MGSTAQLFFDCLPWTWRAKPFVVIGLITSNSNGGEGGNSRGISYICKRACTDANRLLPPGENGCNLGKGKLGTRR